MTAQPHWPAALVVAPTQGGTRWPGAGRVFFLFGGLFTMAMLLMGALVFVVATRAVAQRIDDDLIHHEAKFLRDAAGHPASSAAVGLRIRDWQARKITSERTYSLFAPDGRQIAGRLNLRPRVGLSDVLFLGGGRTWQRGRALADRLPDGSLFVIVQHSEAEAGLRAMLPGLVLATFVTALAAGLGATWFFARLTAQRLAATGDTADAIAAGGDLARRVAMDGLDGMFARQAESLNRMLDRMESLVETQRHFASALAHDLRTPLTRLRASLTASPATSLAGDEARLRDVIDTAMRECNGIIAIFDALLRLAEIEGGRHGGAMADLALDSLVEDIAETMEPVIADAGGTLVTGPIEPATIRGDPGLITQLLVNLLQNVATHTPAGTCARLSLYRHNDTVVLVLRDDGPGLAQGDGLRVLRPFERGRSAAGRRGNGLGLSIAQAIVQFHRGSIELGHGADADGRGLEVRVALPVSRVA
jgi:signal transduction histidine kinase